MPDDSVAPDAARLALHRVLDSPEFASAARLSSFLRYVVTETLAGRSAAIKGYSIAIDVFERPADFDQASDPIVRVEASRLRRALAQYYQGSGAADPIVIELPRGAYVPAFRRRDGEPDAAAVTAEVSGAPDQSIVPDVATWPLPQGPVEDSGASGEAGQSSRWKWFAIRAAAAIPMALAVLLIWDIATRPGGSSQSGDGAVVSSAWSKPLVSFAPFETMTDSEADTRIARGLAREMVAEFARFRNLSIFQIAPGAAPPTTGYVISGSIRRSDNDIRATIQLLKATDGSTIWTETYDRVYTSATLMAVQDEIARAVAIAAAQPYGAIYQHEIERVASEPVDAIGYTCVLRVSDYWRKLDPETHLRMRTCLEKTVELVPDYADGWQAITYIYLDEYRYGFNARPRSVYEPLDKALEAAQRSVSLASTDARSYQSLYAVFFYRGDPEGFKRAGSEAIRLNPNSPDISADFGGKLAFSGAWEEGLPIVRRAISLNPGHPGWYYVSLVLDAYRRGDYRQTLAYIERMNLPNHYRTYIFRAMTYGQIGDRMLAAASVEQLLQMEPDFALNARADLRKWGFESKLIDLCIDGLRKAGLEISDE